MKIAILSDIHGNMEALQAVGESYDELWVLGDLVNYGPNPGEVVDFVRRHAAVVVRGNHDHAIGTGENPRCSAAFTEMAREVQAYTERVLSDEQRAYLRSLPLSARRVVGNTSFFLCHATPSVPLFKYLPASAALWAPEVQSADADVFWVGHTHLPFSLEVGAKRVVNPGSVCQSKHGLPHSCFAIYEHGHIRLESVAYDVNETVKKVQALPVSADVISRLVAVLQTGLPPTNACDRSPR